MASKKKIKIILTGNFDNPQDAFNFFDKNSNGALSKKKNVTLLKEAEISGYDLMTIIKLIGKNLKQAISEM
ncbi:MAG: hypothetical protein L3J14_00280 [Flavobacteriaceae bacterium]|nr:hypothetical protein [Flavobacteriaceae bacterium]